MYKDDETVWVSVTGVLVNVAAAVPEGTTKLTVNEVAPTAVIDAPFKVYAVTEGVAETLSPTAKAPAVGEYVKVAVVDARSAVAVTLKPVDAGVLAGTAALTVKEVVVRAVIARLETAYGAGAATETLSPVSYTHLTLPTILRV